MTILDAIINLLENPVLKIQEVYKAKNRANSMGDALEEYIKDLFSGTLEEKDEELRKQKISEVFSYLGNQNNPPDIILKGGDAIEVKKIESPSSALALNSSYPKAKLFSDSPMIAQACRDCEENWTVKDIIYSVGVLKNNILSSLCFVYGEDYAASKEVYERVKTAISSGILTIPNIEFAETKELGKVKKVDPLGITDLRIRGMWHIENPIKVFKSFYPENKSGKFTFMAIINSEKYLSFSAEKREKIESLQSEKIGFSISKRSISTPDNPAKLKEVYLFTYVE